MGNLMEQTTIADYRSALGGNGPIAAQWKDKPHRLVYDLCNEIDRLNAKLPKTVDGVTIILGMIVWRVKHPTTLGRIVAEIGEGDWVWLKGKGHRYFGRELGSTRKAAEAAGENGENEH